MRFWEGGCIYGIGDTCGVFLQVLKTAALKVESSPCCCSINAVLTGFKSTDKGIL